MSYDIERSSIGGFLEAVNFFGVDPFATDGEGADLTAGGGFLTIIPGQGRQISTGSPGANFHRWAGVASITLAVAFTSSSREARVLADQFVNHFLGKKIDEIGAQASASSTVILDFAADGLTPYIAEFRREASFNLSLIHI